MSTRSEIVTTAAQLALATCQVFGDVATYSNKGGVGVTVYCDPQDESRELADVLGVSAEQTARRFFIPAQTSFPPATSIAIADEITYPTNASYVYSVVRWETDSAGAGYNLDCVRKRVARIK